jgi:hypothetical protein
MTSATNTCPRSFVPHVRFGRLSTHPDEFRGARTVHSSGRRRLPLQSYALIRRAELRGRLPGPPLKGIGEGADFLESEQPGDLRSGERCIAQVVGGEIRSQRVEGFRERQTLYR